MEKNKLSKWEPKLSSKAQEHMARRRAELEPQIALMRVVRRSLGLTQVEVAQLLRVTQSNVSKIEVKGDPSLSILARMAEAKGKKLTLSIEAEDGQIERTFAIG